MPKKQTPLTKENFNEVFQQAFEPYALAIQSDFNKVHSDIKEVKEDLSDVKDTVNRIELIQKSEVKRVDNHSIKLEKHEKRIVKLEHKIV